MEKKCKVSVRWKLKLLNFLKDSILTSQAAGSEKDLDRPDRFLPIQILITLLDSGQVLVNINVKTYLLKRRIKMITTMTRIINRKPPTSATLAITNLVSDDKPSMV